MPAPPIVLDGKAVSGITGSISIVCWIIVFTPQLIENFRRKSSEGLSLLFVILWLSGDLFNILGAVFQNVLPTMLILAIYYTLADFILLFQCLFYRNNLNAQVDPGHLNPATPLLQPLPEDDQANLELAREEVEEEENMIIGCELAADTLDGRQSIWKQVFINTAMVLIVIAAGILGWYISEFSKSSNDDNNNNNDNDNNNDNNNLKMDPLGQFFGWLCALFYLGSRFPQILLNFKRKSCEGISFLFFLFACIGNLTYVISILSWDCSWWYLAVNASWLAGSLGTLFLDLVIFGQFWAYGNREDEDPIVNNQPTDSTYGALS